MDFEKTFRDSRVLLTEAAIVERLRHEFGAPLDEQVNHAGLVYDAPETLAGPYRQYVAIARRFDLPILLMTPTRRVNVRTVARSVYRERSLIPDSVAFLERIRHESGPFSSQVFIGGLLGCQGDAYATEGALNQSEARRFHGLQVARFAETHADFLFAGILPAVEEAAGMAEAMAESGLPYILSFMVRKDGRLLDGTAIVEAIARIDEAADPPPLCYVSNCVHPANLRCALDSDVNRASPRLRRFLGLQANTSPLSPEELDGSETLRRTDFNEMAREMGRLHRDFGFKILGGCCGTDDRFLERLAQVVSEGSHDGPASRQLGSRFRVEGVVGLRSAKASPLPRPARPLSSPGGSQSPPPSPPIPQFLTRFGPRHTFASGEFIRTDGRRGAHSGSLPPFPGGWSWFRGQPL